MLWEKEPFISGDRIQIHASDMRRERTGFHARVAFLRLWKEGDKEYTNILDYDNFNIGRREERIRLANSAYGKLPSIIKDTAYSKDAISDDLNMFCLALPTAWEEQRFSLDFYDVDEEPEPLRSVLSPYIIEGGGSIFFGDPGAGKSYTMLAMACSIGTGCTHIWQVQARPVLYVNMERSGASLRRRFIHVARALGISGSNHQVSFLHARGMSFNAIARKIRSFREIHPTAVGIFDSISRGGQGSLIEDETANRTIDFLNGSFDTWGAIGHTNRSDKSHSFGSTMWDAGEDVGIQLTSEKRLPLGLEQEGRSIESAPASVLGICLTVRKENDLGYVKPFYLAFEFQNNAVVNIRHAKATEFPALLLKEAESDEDKVAEYLNEVGNASATTISKDIGLDRSHVSRLLGASQRFVRIERQGKEVFYGLRSERV